jgi:4,5:9,10-diseco-3-hydroxy-5,9,17-trioxoandrosta-1(10),2-diene-4-oate hydrolase
MRMHYRHAGVGPPLLLLHGLVGSCANWRRNMASLSQDANVYAIDMVNMGQSDRVRGLDASLAATADRLAGFMDALGLAEADVAGHSHGGALAMMLAARHPGRVRSLMLFAPANPFCDQRHSAIRFYQTRLGYILVRSLCLLPNVAHIFALRRMWGDPSRVVRGTLSGYMDGARVPGTVRHVAAILKCWFADMRELEATLPRIASVPALIVWGDRDRCVSLDSAEILHGKLTHSKLVILPTAGHVPFEEIPEICDPLMQEWLRTGLDDQIQAPPRSAAQGRTPASYPAEALPA